MRIIISFCHHYIGKLHVFIIGFTRRSEFPRCVMIRRFQRYAANGVLDAGQAPEAGLAWILCMSWFWEMKKSLAWAILGLGDLKIQ